MRSCQVAALTVYWKPLPLIVMGGSALLGGLLAMVNLPETLGKKLPENMEEALNLGKSRGEQDKQEEKKIAV